MLGYACCCFVHRPHLLEGQVHAAFMPTALVQVRDSKALSPFKDHNEKLSPYNQRSSQAARPWSHYASQVRNSAPVFLQHEGLPQCQDQTQ